MKGGDLIKKIEKMGCILLRHGGNHDWYQNPETKISQPLRRHKEIKDHLAIHILRMLSKKL